MSAHVSPYLTGAMASGEKPVPADRNAKAASVVWEGRLLASPRLAVAYPAMITMAQIREQLRRMLRWLLRTCLNV